jgi:endonuclease V-like protein UPF0215 family
LPATHRGDVLLVGVVTSRTRTDGIVAGKIRRDGANATASMIELVRKSQFIEHIQAVLLQGIAVGGFNVVDTHALHTALGVPVLVVTRRRPDMSEVRRALFSGDPPDRPRVRGAARKWRLIQQAGELEELREPRLWVQRIGLTLAQARDLVRATTLHGNLPEPLRLAHLIAGGITTGKSRGRA